jgi:hypothetical protein
VEDIVSERAIMENVLLGLLNPDNARRAQAEAAFDEVRTVYCGLDCVMVLRVVVFSQMKKQPEQIVAGMMEVLMTSQNADVSVFLFVFSMVESHRLLFG